MKTSWVFHEFRHIFTSFSYCLFGKSIASRKNKALLINHHLINDKFGFRLYRPHTGLTYEIALNEQPLIQIPFQSPTLIENGKPVEQIHFHAQNNHNVVAMVYIFAKWFTDIMEQCGYLKSKFIAFQIVLIHIRIHKIRMLT